MAMPELFVNKLIARLPRKERAQILLQCESIELIFGTVLCEPDQQLAHVYFPLTGFISLVEFTENHPPLEICLIGSEGMLGATQVLGLDMASQRAEVRGSGRALRMSATKFRRELRNNPALLTTLNRYLYVVVAQLSTTVACTHFHQIEPRLARWLLMSHDRAHADHFHLTHKFLADMLGVQRSAITIAAGSLQKRELIHYIRGEISIVDRKGLEAASCPCYNTALDDYARVFT
jgi:CRP-like cAMP-binding protein